MRLSLFVLGLAVLATGCSSTPSPDSLIDGMQARYAADIEGISSLTVTGEGIAARFERTGPDSLLAFDVSVLPADSTSSPSDEAGYVLDYLPNVTQWARGLRGSARVNGERRVGGARTYVLETNDVGAFIGLAPGASRDNIADVAQIFVDAETFRVRGLRLEYRPDSTMERPVVQETFYDQYRDVEGHSFPFEIRRRGEGIDQLMPEEYRIVTQGNLAIEESQAQRLPAGRREAALADIARRRREMETGETTASFQVESVRINTPAPDGPPTPSEP